MDRANVPAPHPANLRPGTVVGCWLEWLEGLPLYEWARRHNPTQAQVSATGRTLCVIVFGVTFP